MKVLTLHQPYASLIASGLKTVETRGWSTKYRGSLAVHAAARRVPTYVHHDVNADLPPMLDSITMSRYWEWTEHPDDPMHGGVYRWVGPLGCVVATCELLDVVPMAEWMMPERPMRDRYEWEPRALLIYGDRLVLHQNAANGVYVGEDVTDQRPFGDYRPGRYAWLLDDITPLDEVVPFRGGQGLSRSWRGV